MSLVQVIRPDKMKVAAAFLVPVAYIAFLYTLNPFYQATLLRNTLSIQALGIVLSILIGMVIYYPLACGIVFLYRHFSRTEKAPEKSKKGRAAKSGRRELVFAVILILVFNPFTYATIFSTINYYNYNVLNKPCGIQVVGFRDSSPARDAGISIGEIITSIDAKPVTDYVSFSSIMNQKNPGEDILIGTNVQEYAIHPIWQNSTTPIIGVEVQQVYCPADSQQNGTLSLPTQVNNDSIIAFAACKQSCIHSVEAGDTLANGPCLLDPIPVQPDWVCDIAHSPRLPVDNLQENQCNFYRTGGSSHFIELSPDCRLLRAG